MIPEKPSSLALKLTSRLFSRAKGEVATAKAQLIQQNIDWHRMDEYRAEADRVKALPSFCDNVCVMSGKMSREFFELQLMPAEPLRDMPYEVMFKRYCVPGRCWTYAFQWWSPHCSGTGPRVVYGSEGTEPLPLSLKLVTQDLDKPQVVRLFERAFDTERIVCRYHHDTLLLLHALAPRSKTYRVVKRLCEKTTEARRVRITAQRAAEAAVKA